MSADLIGKDAKKYIFLKSGKNTHGEFKINDSPRGAYPVATIKSYLEVGILGYRDKGAEGVAEDAPAATSENREKRSTRGTKSRS